MLNLENVGNFKGQRDATSNWLSIPNSEVPKPRPGKCVDNSRELPMRTVNFVKMHTLMESSVPAVYGRPLLTRVASKNRFTAIATDSQVESLNGDRYDVLFIGTDNGRVIKSINYLRSATNTNESIVNQQNGSAESERDQESVNLETVVITETQALPYNLPVKQMTVAKDQQSLIVVGSGHIVSIPLHHCSDPRIVHCRDCLNFQDPYCVWDVKNHECTTMLSVTPHNRKNFIQNIRQMRKDSSIDICKKNGEDIDYDVSNDSPNLGGGNVVTNSVNPSLQTNVASTRGTVSSVGPVAPVLPGNDIYTNAPNSRENEIIRSAPTDNLDIGIDIESIPEESGELGVVVQRNSDAQISGGSNSSSTKMTAMAHPIFASVIFIVFAVGLAIGFILSKRLKFAHSPFDILRSGSSGSGSTQHHFNEHHRNQLNYYDKSGGRNTTSGKDINLLMNVMGPYIAAQSANNVNGRTPLTNAGCQTPNNLNKKDILELDFETKDRSHECKNSTEHLDINDLKVNANNNTNSNCNNTTTTTTPAATTTPTAVIVNTTNTGTLQKVKKTYL